MTELIKHGIRWGAAAAVAYTCSTFAKAPDRRAATAWVSAALVIAVLGRKYVVSHFFPAEQNRSYAQEQIYLMSSHVWDVLSAVGLYQLGSQAKLPPLFTAFGIYACSFLSVDIINHGFKALNSWQKKGYLNKNTSPLAYHFFQSQGRKEAHCKTVMERASTPKETTLFIQETDTMEEKYNFHTALAISWKDQGRAEFLGIAQQTMQASSEKEKNYKDGLGPLQEIGAPPSDCQWIYIGAQCRNLYAYFSNVKQQKWKSVVSADPAESVVIEGNQQKLQAWLGSLQNEKCEVDLKLGQEKSTPIKVTLSWGEADPFSSEEAVEKMTLTYIRASSSEMDWTLVTDLEVNNRQDVENILKIYDQQPMIKKYHHYLKMGHQVIGQQLPIDLALSGVLGIVTAELMRCMEEIKHSPNSPPEKVFSEKAVQIIQERFKLDNREITSGNILDHIGLIGGESTIGGFWRGWLRLQDMIEGATLLKTEDKKSS